MQSKDTQGLKIQGGVASDPLRNLGAFMTTTTASKQLEQKYQQSRNDDEDDEVERIVSVDDDGQPVLEMDFEEQKQEIMQLAGQAILNDTSNAGHISDDEDEDIIVVNGLKRDEDDGKISMREIAIMHMAKKNLSFELEYIQLVCQNLESGNSQQMSKIREKIEENPLLALGSNEESKGVRFAEEEEKKRPQKVDEATRKLRVYLENSYDKLNQMKKEILKDENKLTRDELRKHLTTMACFLERTRLYLDNYIYPRDLSLNLIDVEIEESSVVDKKRQMHLTERLYTIVYKDFFTAYERAVLFHNKIQKYIGKDISDHEQLMHTNTQIQVSLDNDILENERESIQIASQDLEANKLGKDAEDAKKHISRKDGAVATDIRSMIKILAGFNTSYVNLTSVDEIMDNEFTFCLRFKTVLSANTELQMTLFEENSRSFSMTAVYDHQISINSKNDSCFFFVNIPMKSILMGNLALIIKVIEKKPSRNPSISLSVLGQEDQTSTNKIYRGYSILPISKLFWIQQLKVKQIYEIKEAQIYKPLTPHLIEDKYSTMIEKRGFKKYKDVQMTQQYNLSYTYRIESKIKEEIILKKPNAMIVRRGNFDTSLFYSKDSDSSQAALFRQKVEKYRFNDLQIDLNSAVLSDNFLKKTPIMRVEVTLRDNFGMIYDTVYKTISDGVFNFTQTYESLIYPLETTDFRMSESFFIRIPTKSLETLKKIYMIFQVQTLVNLKDSKGNKYKQTNFQNDIENLQFRTEMVAVLPLYDSNEKCILKNRQYSLELLQIEDYKKPIPTKWENFRQIPGVSNLRPSTERLMVQLRLISNEFTHNTYINNLLQLKETSLHEQEVEIILKELKKLKDSNDQLLFHDKILDKLFQLMSTNKDGELAELIFETIIMMIDLFQSRYTDYKDVLENYIQKHFAQSRVYIALLQQILIVSENIKEGLVESAQNEQKNSYVLMSMKYLGIILKIVRNSYLEALQCQEGSNDDVSGKFEKHGNGPQPNTYRNPKFDQYKRSIIDEENEEDSDEEGEDAFARNTQRSSRMRKTAIRKTLTGNQNAEPIQTYEQPRDLTKRQFGAQIQEALRNIFEGCHKDAMKTTLSLRAILYENITTIFQHITDFMDDQFLQSILHFVYEEQQVQLLGIPTGTAANKESKQADKQKSTMPSQSTSKPTTGGILKKTQAQEESKNKANNKNTRRSEMQSVGGQMIMLDLNFFENEANVKALQDYNWINEEAITKIKIIAMGRLLQQGIFDKIQGDTNKIIMSFCHNIEKYHLKRDELNMHVLYFLYCLFQYLKSPDEFSDAENEITGGGIKLKIFSKRYLDMREFFAKILPEISNHLKSLLKDANIEDRVKEQKFPDDVLKPFKEKSSLILLSMLNNITQDKFQYVIFNEHKKLLAVVKNLKKLSNKLTFQEPYQIFFEKKKIQVIRKIIMYIINIFMTKEPEQIPVDYHATIHQCRLMMIYLWNKLAKINQDYKKTTRARSLVKDQLKVYKGKMLEQYRAFWHKFKQLGQPWMVIKNSLSKQFQNFIKLSSDKAINLYMEVVNDTLSIEYKETKDIKNTSTSIFKVYYDLNMTNGRDHNAIKFYETFEKIMTQENETYKKDVEFQKKVHEKFQQLKQLSDAIVNVNYSKEHLKENTFYRAYCMAQLIEVLWELKLFPLFMENQTQFENLNKALENNLEIAFTALRFVESLDHQTEDDRTKIGQREIVARIQLQSLKRVETFFSKAEFYEKAIEILNKQKDIAENVLYDYNMVSLIVKSQYKIYRKLAEDQDRHFAIYFKVGFFGQSYPDMLRNKEFIYRGRKLVKRSDIKDRFLKYFPDSLTLDHSNYPDKATLLSDKKSFQIQKVDPMTYVELKDFGLAENTKDKEELEIGRKAKDLPQKLRAYYLENFKNKFYRQTMLDNKNDDELQKDRLIEIFKVKSKFPTVYNMQEIIKVKKFVRHAIDEAVRNVQMIIDQIETLKKTATSTEDPSDFEFLTSQIRAALESPIQGGIEKFINTFITEVNLKGNQREKTLILFAKIEECNQVIDYGIQAIQSFTNNETMLNKINGDYKNFKEKINKVRQYIDGKVI